MSLWTKAVGLIVGKSVEKAVDGVIDGLDALIYTDEEKAADGANSDAAQRVHGLRELKLLIESEREHNKEANVFLRLLQKLPRIIGGNAVMVWFAWNLFLHTAPEWALENGCKAYSPDGQMAALLMVIFGAVWITRTIEKKIGVSNK